MEVKTNPKTKIGVSLTMRYIALSKSKIDNSDTHQVFMKKYRKTYTGCLFQTHSLVDVLDLSLA